MQVRIAMKYFTKKSLDFLKELEQNNDRDWFHANKSRFQNDLEIPFRDFIENLIDEFQAIDPKIVITAKEAIFRIYRDVRFSNDKSPYKTHMSAIISAGGRKNLIVPGFYVELQKDKMMLYAGIYNPDTKTLEKIRYYIAEHGVEFKKLIADKDFVKVFGEIQGEKSKIIPKQFKEDAAEQPLLYNKAFYYMHEVPQKVVLGEDLISYLGASAAAAQKLNVFFRNAI